MKKIFVHVIAAMIAAVVVIVVASGKIKNKRNYRRQE